MLKRIKARRAAIDYPWRPGNDGGSVVCGPETPKSDALPQHQNAHEYYGGKVVCETVSDANKTFIIHAANDIDWLITRVERKIGTLQALWILFVCGCMLCGILFMAAYMAGWGWRLAG